MKTLLGHRDVETTREIYLEPVRGLQVEIFMHPEDDSYTQLLEEHEHILDSQLIVRDPG